jgi:hypothetical protein
VVRNLGTGKRQPLASSFVVGRREDVGVKHKLINRFWRGTSCRYGSCDVNKKNLVV